MASIPAAALRFALGGMLVFGSAYAVSEQVDPVFPELRAKVALLQERRDRIEAVAVGNSHGMPVEFPALGDDGLQLSLGGQDALESAYLARYVADEAPRLRYVLFGASYGLQQVDHAVLATGDLRVRRRQVYARVPLRRPMPGDWQQWVVARLAPVVRDDHWKGVARRVLRPARSMRLTPDGRRIVRPRLPLDRDGLFRHGAHKGGEYRARGLEMVSHAPSTPARVAAALDSLAHDLGERGIALVFYTPPYHASFLREQDQVVVDEGSRMLERIVARNEGARWLDYSRDPRFAARDDFFMNSDHLGPEGGRTFSVLLGECLRSTAAGAASDGCPRVPVGDVDPLSPRD